MERVIGTGNGDADGANPSLLVKPEVVTLRQQATDILRQAIVDHRFPPGKRLVERELCELLGMSRTSVREALRHLESERLIRMTPHRGPVVTSLTADEARQIYAVRAVLDGLAGELFASNATDQMVDRLRRVAEDLDKAAVEADPREIVAIKSRFYEILFSGAQNDVCAQLILSLNSRVWLLRRMSLTSPGRTVTMMEEVWRIVDAAVARDPAAMKAACIAHVESACAAALPELVKAEEEERRASASRKKAGRRKAQDG